MDGSTPDESIGLDEGIGTGYDLLHADDYCPGQPAFTNCIDVDAQRTVIGHLCGNEQEGITGESVCELINDALAIAEGSDLLPGDIRQCAEDHETIYAHLATEFVDPGPDG
jgi:hypothetical protein